MNFAARIHKKRYLSRALIYLLTWSLLVNTTLPVALALEAIDVTGSTGVVGTKWGDHTVIGTGHGAIINWNNFDTSSAQSVTFKQHMGGQLSSASAVLNRISSGSVPTQFNGALNANGRVFVVNPAGIIFGAGSTVNVSQLVASGLSISDEAFNAILADPANQMAFEGGGGQVKNLGSISADSVYLVGGNVTNVGSIKAPDGLVVMAAGKSIYLAQDGSDVMVEITGESSGADVQNRSLISAERGKIVLAAGDSFSGAVSNAGVIAASAGEVVVESAHIENAGEISVDSAKNDAGSINIAAKEEIALQTGSSTTANSETSGNGGEVILDSEGMTVVSEGASIEATGGSESGDGGFVEVSGEHFVLAGNVDTSAANGAPGTLLIDPLDVAIADGTNLGALDTVYEEDIESDSQAGTNVLVEAENSITVQNISDDEITGGAGDIRLRTTDAFGSISFNDKEDTISTTEGYIVLETGSGGIDIGSLMAGRGLSGKMIRPGRITISTSNGGDIVTKNLYVDSGAGHAEIYVDASGNLSIEGDVSVGTPSNGILDIPGRSQAEALIHLTADADVTLGGNVGAYADGTDDTDADAITHAYITVRSGADGTPGRDITVMADLSVLAETDTKARSRGYVTLGASDKMYFGPDAAAPVADAGEAHAEGYDDDRDSVCGRHIAKIIINSNGIETLPEPQRAPDSEPGSTTDPDPEPTPEPDPVIEPELEPVPATEPESEPEPENKTLVAASIPPAPVPDEKLDTSGCSSLMKWAAKETGIDPKKMNVWMSNSLALANGIHPCDTCARLKKAAMLLRDYPGTRIAALNQVINEFASSSAPLSEEMDASITAVIMSNSQGDSRYAKAGAYLDSLAEYVAILNSEMNFSAAESMMLAADRYVAPIAEGDNPALAGFLAARLTALAESQVVSASSF